MGNDDGEGFLSGVSEVQPDDVEIDGDAKSLADANVDADVQELPRLLAGLGGRNARNAQLYATALIDSASNIPISFRVFALHARTRQGHACDTL